MQTGKSISYKNANLYYRTAGYGKCVLLLHGLAEDGNIWNELAEALEENFHVIVPDIPGSGKSDLLYGENITIDDYAGAIKYILDHESIGTCSMIGHSMGGYITLAFAEKFPESINSIGLFHSTAFADDEEKIQSRLKAINVIKARGTHAYLKTFIPNLFTENFIKEHYDVVEKQIRSGLNFTADALIQYHQAMIRRPDRSNILKQYSNPVLFIAGEKDKVIPLNTLLKQSHLPLICHFHILSNTAHMGMLEEKDKSQTFVLDFVRNLEF